MWPSLSCEKFSGAHDLGGSHDRSVFHYPQPKLTMHLSNLYCDMRRRTCSQFLGDDSSKRRLRVLHMRWRVGWRCPRTLATL